MRNDESGVVIVEATIVFPVMFLVIFLLIFMGNAYFQKSRVELIVTELTLDGAAYCARPMLRTVDKTGIVPTYAAAPKSEPYRYFFDMREIKEYIQKELKSRLGNVNTGLFSGMRPTTTKTEVKFNNYFIYSTFSIDLDYRVTVPVRLLGAKDAFVVNVKTHSETPVTDVPEFIRNINMIEDYLAQTGAQDKITQAVEKAKSIFAK